MLSYPANGNPVVGSPCEALAPAALLLAALALVAFAPPASAKWYGSTLKGKPNATYGCESALTSGTFGFGLSPTNQSSCTYRHGGYLFRNRFTFVVPGHGADHQDPDQVRAPTRPARG